MSKVQNAPSAKHQNKGETEDTRDSTIIQQKTCTQFT